MSSRKKVAPPKLNGSAGSCEGCWQPIWLNTPYYSVSRGFLDDIVTATDALAEKWHLHCLDPYLLLIEITPHESVAVTLHDA